VMQVSERGSREDMVMMGGDDAWVLYIVVCCACYMMCMLCAVLYVCYVVCGMVCNDVVLVVGCSAWV